ncbi:hypothetical protein ACFL2T_01180 [Elusimicrobiota bacterium]
MTMEIKPNPSHTTRDLFEATAIAAALQVSPHLRPEGRVVYFEFRGCADAQAVAARHWSGELQVNSKQFAHALRDLKDRVFAELRRNGDQSNGRTSFRRP